MGYIHTINIDGTNNHLIEPKLYAIAGGTSSALTANIDNFSLFSGAYVHIKINTVNDGATLNVNNTGAIGIYYDNAQITSTILSANHIYTFIYDGSYWNVIGDITGNDIMIGTTAEWQAKSSYIPPQGTILIYTDYSSIIDNNITKAVAGIKIGDGVTPGIDKAFVGEDVKRDVLNHINDSVRHITSTERTFWNNKLNCDIVNEELQFNRS